MAEYLPVGPGYGWVGDPTTASGADMDQLNEIEDARLDLGIANMFVTTGLAGGAPIASGVYAMPPEPTMQLQINDLDIDNVILLMPGGEKITATTNDALAFGGLIEQLTLSTFAFVPAGEAVANSSTPHVAPHAIWFPAFFTEGFNGIAFSAPGRNARGNQPYNVTIRAAKRDQDQDAQDIPNRAKFGFMGKPAALGFATAWTLPALVA